MQEREKKFILWFAEISMRDVPLVGGKNAALGEMYSNLTKKGVNIPNGFAITSYAYRYFLEKAGLKPKIQEVIKDLNVYNVRNLKDCGRSIRQIILKAELPLDLKEEIKKSYRELSLKYKVKNLDVAVRSSATAEDLPQASFAGQQETFLNIRGETVLLEAVKKCFASLFTDRAIFYREEMKFDHFKVALSVGIQKMVRADKASSGVMFSCDTESGFPDVVLINASYGLGENVVQGKVNPDQYYVFETTLKKGFCPIIAKVLGTKDIKMIYSKGKKPTRNVRVASGDREKFSLTDDEILSLAKWSLLIENHYKKPMDMEWARDGNDGKLYILQARPETVKSRRNVNTLETYVLDKKKVKTAKVITTGLAVGDKIGQGKAHVILDVKGIDKFQKGEVLITDMTDPDWVPAMRMASAIVTDSGGRTAHAAIVSRELGVPCIVGTGNVTRRVKSGELLTVSCSEGEIGKVYQGKIPFAIRKINLAKITRPKTKIMMNLGEPGEAFALSFLPNDGIGLAREEFIIASDIKVHPLALVHYPRLKDKKAKKAIEKLTKGYKDKKQFFIDKLTEGIGKIAAAFYPKDVIVRFSDFKTNEYADLVGGKEFEPEESNPMIGWRGASRYYDPKYQEAFKLELLALKKARKEFGLTNIIPMVPFCRTLDEGKKVLQLIRKVFPIRANPRLHPHKSAPKLKVYVMCEIPSNVILAEKFLEIFDGMSIGSNDLTQLVLGLDRDSGIISHIGDERDEAVKEMLAKVIKIARRKGKYIGICGQAPSDWPEIAEFLAAEGIDSISLNPDSVLKTTVNLARLEKGLSKRRL